MCELKDILEIIFSWQLVVIIVLIIFKNPINNIIKRLIDSDSGKARIGLFEIELGKVAEKSENVINNINKLNYLMAESRLLELEITNNKFSIVFSQEQNIKMNEHIKELKKLIKKYK
jgi:hypothetical protein